MGKEISIPISCKDTEEPLSEVQARIVGSELKVTGLSEEDRLAAVAINEEDDTFYVFYIAGDVSLGRDYRKQSRLSVGKSGELRNAKISFVENCRDGGSWYVEHSYGGISSVLFIENLSSSRGSYIWPGGSKKKALKKLFFGK